MKKEIAHPHDRLVKHAFSNIYVAKEFFQRHLPQEIQRNIDLSTLQLCNSTYVDEELKMSQADVLYKASIAGEVGYLYTLLEHQSTPDPLMPFRLLKYTVNIWQDYLNQTKTKQLPLVIPLVLYSEKDRYECSQDLKALIQAPSALIEQFWLKPF